MAKKAKAKQKVNEEPYLELGNLLQAWRKESHSSALSFYKENKISVSYSVYANFERGKILPPPAFIAEFAELLGKQPAEAMYLWARLQMPTPELAAIFDKTNAPRLPAKAAAEDSVSPPELENTYVMGSVEMKLMLKYPFFWDLITAMTIVHPEEIRFDNLKLPRGMTKKKLLEEVLLVPITAEKIIVSDTGMKLATPHAHIPKTKEWDKVRASNMQGVVRDLFKYDKKETCRKMIHRTLTPQQHEYWLGELLRMSDDFKQDTYINVNSESYVLNIMYGRRDLLDLSDEEGK